MAGQRARYYDASLGRFVNRDPIGYEGSEWNLYEYVGGEPISDLDPYGTTSLFQALRICASEKSFIKKKECICTLLPESPACTRLSDCSKHLDDIGEYMQKLKDALERLKKAVGKKAREEIQKEIDVLRSAPGNKGSIKGHCKEVCEKWARNKEEYGDDVCETLTEIVGEDKEILRYCERLLKK